MESDILWTIIKQLISKKIKHCLWMTEVSQKTIDGKQINNNRQSAEEKDSGGWNSSPIQPRERCLVCVEIRPFELEGGSFSRCLPPPDRCALLRGYDRRRLRQWQELVGFVEARTIEDRSSSDVARRSANRRPSSQLLKKKEKKKKVSLCKTKTLKKNFTKDSCSSRWNRFRRGTLARRGDSSGESTRGSFRSPRGLSRC